MEFMVQIYGYVYKAVCSIPDGWPFKLAVGAILLIIARHAMLFTAFTALVAIDLFAKFIALSYEMLKAQGVENPSFVESIKSIPEAHRQRIINSHEMKTQFLGKILMYIFAVITAGLADFMIGHVNFGQMVIAYLASTELLSVIENLDDAGVSALHGLVSLVKRKTGGA
nr:MAG TPA: holin [Caudoviricetes sp.]